jgi:hypothetical protein
LQPFSRNVRLVLSWLDSPIVCRRAAECTAPMECERCWQVGRDVKIVRVLLHSRHASAMGQEKT